MTKQFSDGAKKMIEGAGGEPSQDINLKWERGSSGLYNGRDEADEGQATFMGKKIDLYLLVWTPDPRVPAQFQGEETELWMTRKEAIVGIAALKKDNPPTESERR